MMARAVQAVRAHAGLAAILVAGLALRLALLPAAAGVGLEIVDEQHYHALAQNVAHGHGFAFEPGKPTSIRPPLYPAFVALVWKVVGSESLQAVRAVQILLALATVVVVYAIGLRLFERRVALLAAAGLCFYPSLVLYDYLLLTEVLFTFLLTLTVLAYVSLLQHERPRAALATGVALGLAALARSILWPFPLLLCPLTAVVIGGSVPRRLATAALVGLGFAAVVGPWAARNTRLQGTFTVVDTMGGLNLYMGNYEHTPEDRPWDAISLTGEKSWAHELHREHPPAASPPLTEGQKEQWAKRKAAAFMREHKAVTLRRAALKLAHFWGLERELVAGIQRGMYPLPRAAAIATIGAIGLSYPAVVLLACLGVFLAPPSDRRAHLFLILVCVHICALHTIVFGHSRYHLPLVPILLLYAAAAVHGRSWARLRERPAAAAAAGLTMAVMAAIWARELLVVEADRLRALFRGLAGRG